MTKLKSWTQRMAKAGFTKRPSSPRLLPDKRLNNQLKSGENMSSTYKNAKNAIQKLFEDDSISKEECIEFLDELGSDIETYVDVLNEELDHEDNIDL